ncbi:methyltransferase domain-containing protein [Desulfovibrio sp. OttesenSCG-928-I05]|nr:methyltransferase domain-containing protein [Desulfovibrio sp. OttesenSCG-928-I05]
MEKTPQPYTWKELKQQERILLYAGDLKPHLAQYATHIGMNPTYSSERCIIHDARDIIPLSENSVEVYQCEDVFEHIEYKALHSVFNDIHRILKPGGLFRLSVPDYRCDVYAKRSLYDNDKRIVFDPGGGGSYSVRGVGGGGHLWFPILEMVLYLFSQSKFDLERDVTVLHAYLDETRTLLRPIDYSLGYIQRTPDNDDRVKDPYRPLSIVVDAYKH